MTFELLHSTCNALRDRTILTIRKEVDTELAPFRSDIEHIRSYDTGEGWVNGEITKAFTRRAQEAWILSAIDMAHWNGLKLEVKICHTSDSWSPLKPNWRAEFLERLGDILNEFARENPDEICMRNRGQIRKAAPSDFIVTNSDMRCYEGTTHLRVTTWDNLEASCRGMVLVLKDLERIDYDDNCYNLFRQFALREFRNSFGYLLDALCPFTEEWVDGALSD